MSEMSFTNNISVLVSVLAICLAIAPDQAGACSNYFPKFTTIIENLMSYPIRVHCRSKDDDLGEHILDNYGDSTRFSYHPDFFGRTHFWCDVLWQGVWKAYDAYLERRDYYRCWHNDCTCHWGITPQGPCFYNVDSKKFEWCVPWTK